MPIWPPSNAVPNSNSRHPIAQIAAPAPVRAHDGAYSDRRLSIGFTIAARRAGNQLASAAAPTNTIDAST
jgi:hypothetical protein